MPKDDRRAAYAGSNEMIQKLLDLVAMNAAGRMQSQAWGEVTIKVLWERGTVKSVRFVEESVMRSPEEIPATGA